MAAVRKHVFVSGRVQGVCFRYYGVEAAECAGVSGWIRNLPDGRVEAVAEGDEAAVECFLDYCRSGPPMGIVRRVEVTDEEPMGDLAGFHVRR